MVVSGSDCEVVPGVKDLMGVVGIKILTNIRVHIRDCMPKI